MVAVCAAHRLVDDLVDQAQRLETVRRDAQGLGRFLRLLAGLPENGGTALGADHRIDGILQHQQLVAHAQRQRPARATLANDGGDDGHFQLRHLVDIAADGFRLASLFGVDARKGTGRVDKGEHGQLELFGGLQQAQRFAVALGARHAKVAQRTLFGVAPFLVA